MDYFELYEKQKTEGSTFLDYMNWLEEKLNRALGCLDLEIVDSILNK